MSIFQPSVLKNVSQDESIVAQRWAAFQAYLAKTDFIKEVKEEKYQDGFFKDVFENALGYTLDSTDPADFNLEREKKNETDAKKADGALYLNGEVIGVVELKDQKTKNLDAIEAQAFNYHNSHANSRYIIISNFDELRFYIDKKTAYEKFSLFSLNYEEFKKLHLLLSFESIKEGLPLKLKEKSANFEQTISKELYRDFSQFRTHLFENIIKNNYESSEQIATSSEQLTDTLRHPVINTVIPAKAGIQSVDSRVKHEDDRLLDKSALLRLTQKLCDRIIFILFAEDRGLLTPNTIKEIREEFQNQKFTSYTLYDIYKFYFNAINEGNEKLNIPRYNGGLFAKDELLDSLVIEDAYLDLKAQKLSDFDFVSDISVNILGHIFEQSLTDLEEMNASINETEFDKKKSKRKKDGIFYTPEYITRYIVENTLGKLCEEKKTSWGLTGIEEPQNRKKLTKAEKETLVKLYEYRDWLLNLKILDPACGSGAFLNQALEFLIREHKHVDDYRRAYENEMLSLYDIETNILEHNLYGVDINEDAVEIAKLSLWLRTAQKGRMLTNLSDKIVCANSLLDMPFCNVIASETKQSIDGLPRPEGLAVTNDIGCFDVVIGNPPYIKEYTNKNAFDGLRDSPYYQGKMDLWYFFGCQALDLIKENGLIGFIAPNNWISNAGASKFRNKVLNDGKILEFIDFGDFKVFEDAGIQTMIYVMTKTKNNENYKLQVSKLVYKNITHIEASDFLYLKNSNHFESFISTINKTKQLDNIISFSNQTIEIVLDKIKNQQNFVLEDKEVAQGIVGAPDKAFIIKKTDINNFREDELQYIKRFHTNCGKYYTETSDKFIIYLSDKNFNNQKVENYPNLENHFKSFKDELIEAKIKYKTPNKMYYYLHRERDESFFNKGAKIICSTRTLQASNTYTEEEFYGSRALNFIKTDRINLKLLVCILNSKMVNFWLKFKGKMTGDLLQIDKSQLISIPIKNTIEQQPFIELVDEILEAKEKIKKYKKHFDTLNAVDKIEITEEIEKLEAIVQNNENTIDQMVYKLYGLTDDEIRVVEGV